MAEEDAVSITTIKLTTTLCFIATPIGKKSTKNHMFTKY